MEPERFPWHGDDLVTHHGFFVQGWLPVEPDKVPFLQMPVHHHPRPQLDLLPFFFIDHRQIDLLAIQRIHDLRAKQHVRPIHDALLQLHKVEVGDSFRVGLDHADLDGDDQLVDVDGRVGTNDRP